MNGNNEIDIKLKLLIDILGKKSEELDVILAITENQEVVIGQPPGDERAAMFREMTDEKQRHIDEVLSCDAVFQSVFDSIKDDVEADSARYRERLLELQRLIEPVMELDIKIRAQEAKNRAQLEASFPLEHHKGEAGPVAQAEKNRLLEEYKRNKK